MIKLKEIKKEDVKVCCGIFMELKSGYVMNFKFPYWLFQCSKCGECRAVLV